MADPSAPESNVPDPRLAILEAGLEREREISRAATTQLTALSSREAQIAQSHRPPEPPISVGSGWTIDTLMTHLLSMREADRRFYEERDRRYAEVNVEKEKALKIKETADLAALQLAREIQTYKDEKANELREQIGSERGLYATKDDLAVVLDKMETATTPIVRDISEIRQALARGPEGLDSLQARADRGDGERTGTSAAHRQREVTFGQMVAVVMAALVFLSIVMGAVALIIHG